MTQLLIARHGNTFEPDECPVRIGKRSDLPLVEHGKQQARYLGDFLAQAPFSLAAVYTSHLIRSYDTVAIALQQAKLNLSITKTAIFNEVDYGIDEGKTEAQIVARIGQDSLLAWEQAAVVPCGWLINTHQIIQNWRDFADMLKVRYTNQTVLVVTSHGIARFAPYLTGSLSAFKAKYSPKLTTGAIASLLATKEDWQVNYWNIPPKSALKQYQQSKNNLSR